MRVCIHVFLCKCFLGNPVLKILQKCPAFGLILLRCSRCSARGHTVDLRHKFLILLQRFGIQSRSYWSREGTYRCVSSFLEFLKPCGGPVHLQCWLWGPSNPPNPVREKIKKSTNNTRTNKGDLIRYKEQITNWIK